MLTHPPTNIPTKPLFPHKKYFNAICAGVHYHMKVYIYNHRLQRCMYGIFYYKVSFTLKIIRLII